MVAHPADPYAGFPSPGPCFPVGVVLLTSSFNVWTLLSLSDPESYQLPSPGPDGVKMNPRFPEGLASPRRLLSVLHSGVILWP